MRAQISRIGRLQRRHSDLLFFLIKDTLARTWEKFVRAAVPNNKNDPYTRLRAPALYHMLPVRTNLAPIGQQMEASAVSFGMESYARPGERLTKRRG